MAASRRRSWRPGGRGHAADSIRVTVPPNATLPKNCEYPCVQSTCNVVSTLPSHAGQPDVADDPAAAMSAPRDVAGVVGAGDEVGDRAAAEGGPGCVRPSFAFTSVTRSIGGTGDGVDFGRFFVELRGMVAAVEEPECFLVGGLGELRPPNKASTAARETLTWLVKAATL